MNSEVFDEILHKNDKGTLENLVYKLPDDSKTQTILAVGLIACLLLWLMFAHQRSVMRRHPIRSPAGVNKSIGLKNKKKLATKKVKKSNKSAASKKPAKKQPTSIKVSVGNVQKEGFCCPDDQTMSRKQSKAKRASSVAREMNRIMTEIVESAQPTESKRKTKH